MARLPDPSQFDRRIPQAGRPVASYRAGLAEEAMGRLGGQVAEMASREADRLNALQAEDALNKLAEKKLELTYGQNGFAKVRGGNALSGKLTDTYPQQFNSAVDEISNGLANDAQRQLFRQHASKQMLGFKSDVLRHVISESENYDDQVQQGTFSVATEQAAANWNDPIAVLGAKANIEDAIESRVKSGRLAPEAAQALRLDKLSKLNTAVVMRALQERNLDYAETYLKEHGKDMDVADLVKASGLVNTAKKTQVALATADEVMKSALPKLQPNEWDRLWSITASTESNNQDFGKDGKPVTSPKGALYAMQVMPATAKNPGYGIKPAADDSPEEYNRVGREYLAVMVKEFGGDLSKAWAAYNAGPGAVEAAMKKAEKSAKLAANDPALKPVSWINFMPAETREYVEKNMKKYDGNFNVTAPTILDLKAQVAERLKDEAPEVIEAAKAKVEANYNDWQADRRQREDNLLTSIMDQVDAGQVTSLADLDPQTLQSLGDKRTAARSYIESAGRRGDKMLESSQVATTFYYELYTDPVKLKSQSVADIMGLSSELGQARVNHLLQKRAEYLNRPEKEQAAVVDADQFKALSAKFGFDPKNKDHQAEIIQIKDRVEQAVSALQEEQKRALTRDEKGKLISRMMIEFPAVKYKTTGLFDSGWLSGSGTDAKRGYAIENPENIVIPDKAKAAIQKAAETRGITLSTPAQWRDAYAAYLMAERGL